MTPATGSGARGFSIAGARAPGGCVPWKEHLYELDGSIKGRAELAERVWQAADAGGAMFIWQMMRSF